jgi:RNA polymerase sigma-70 factor (ECF subfamily)
LFQYKKALNPNEDQILFNQIVKGQKQAFDMLFKKYYGQLVRYAMTYLHDGSTAEEIVQDVFVKIWEFAPRMDISTTLAGYIYKSVRNHCLNYLKHEGIKKKYEKEHEIKELHESEMPDEIININYFRKLLGSAVRDLPQKCREIFEMAKFDGLTYEEISQYLEVSVKTVENQMGIALKKLRETMQPFASKIYDR